MPTPPLTRSIGTAERALRALLERELSREQVSFAQWTALVFTSAAPLSMAEVAQRQLAGRVVASESESRREVQGLLARGSLTQQAGGALQHSEQGRALFTRLSQAVEQLTGTLFADLPPADLEATHRTLLEVGNRADRMLGAA